MKKALVYVRAVLIAFLIWLFMCADMGRIYPNIYAQPESGTVIRIITVLQRFGALFSEFSLLKEVLFVILIVLCIYFAKKQVKIPVIFIVLDIILVLFYLFSESFRDTDSNAYIFGDVFMFIVSVLRGMGLFFGLKTVFFYLLSFLDDGRAKESGDFKGSYLKVLLVIFILWLPCLIALYPGGYPFDVQIQLRQFFGYEVLSDAHPPFNAFFVGSFVRIGNLIGNNTFGFFLATFMHFLFMLFTVSYATWFIAKRIKSNVFFWTAVLFVGTTSLFVVYSSSLGKDAPYSCGLLMMAVFFVKILEKLKEKVKLKGMVYDAVLFSVFSLITSLTRHNGIYITIIMLAVMLFVFLKNSDSKGCAFSVTGIACAGAVLFLLINYVVYPLTGVERTSGALIYTNMLQHVARINDLYPDEITDADIAVINKVADYSKFSERYNPITSDGIKSVTDLDADDTAVKEFKKLWFAKVKKHPMVLIDSAYNMTYGFFAPVSENVVNDFSNWYYESEWPEFDFKIPFAFSAVRNLYSSVLYVFVSLPVERFIHNPGLYSWILLFTLTYIIYKKKYAYICALIPGIMTFLVYAITPSYFGHPRYCFPLVYAAIMYIGLCICFGRENDNTKTETD